MTANFDKILYAHLKMYSLFSRNVIKANLIQQEAEKFYLGISGGWLWMEMLGHNNLSKFCRVFLGKRATPLITRKNQGKKGAFSCLWGKHNDPSGFTDHSFVKDLAWYFSKVILHIRKSYTSPNIVMSELTTWGSSPDSHWDQDNRREAFPVMIETWLRYE